jgi:hypothetical protein
MAQEMKNPVSASVLVGGEVLLPTSSGVVNRWSQQLHGQCAVLIHPFWAAGALQLSILEHPFLDEVSAASYAAFADRWHRWRNRALRPISTPVDKVRR